jgi:CelD/BcsL family acetyltransferase involved in cellulose biosynthesis
LRIGSETAAVNYGFHVRDRAYSYIAGFNPDFAKVSPGSLAVRHAISEAVREGAQEFDFLRGGEFHKYRWGASDRRQYRVQVHAALAHATDGRTQPRPEVSSPAHAATAGSTARHRPAGR